MGRPVLSGDQLQHIETYVDAVLFLEQENVISHDQARELHGFGLLPGKDKEKLVGVPFIIIEYEFKIGRDNSNFVECAIITTHIRSTSCGTLRKAFTFNCVICMTRGKPLSTHSLLLDIRFVRDCLTKITIMLPVMAYLPKVVHTIYLKTREWIRGMSYAIPPYTLLRYTRQDILDALTAAGFPDWSLDTMAAIGVAESSWTTAIQKGQPYATTGWGTWQITPGNSVPHVGVDMDLLDLHVNARAAMVKFSERGYHPWSTWTNG